MVLAIAWSVSNALVRHDLDGHRPVGRRLWRVLIFENLASFRSLRILPGFVYSGTLMSNRL